MNFRQEQAAITLSLTFCPRRSAVSGFAANPNGELEAQSQWLLIWVHRNHTTRPPLQAAVTTKRAQLFSQNPIMRKEKIFH